MNRIVTGLTFLTRFSVPLIPNTLFRWQKERCRAPIGFGDDPDLRLVFEAVRGEEPQAVDERILVLRPIVLVELAPVSGCVEREKLPRILTRLLDRFESARGCTIRPSANLAGGPFGIVFLL